MANFRRRRPRHGVTARENSSDWRYPQIEKGDSQRSTVSAKRWAQKANDKLQQYIQDSQGL